MSKNKKTIKPLPIKIIDAAASGDIEAMRKVISHYDGYIRSLATIKVIDELGRRHLVIDETLRSDLEIVLITKVMGFKMTG